METFLRKLRANLLRRSFTLSGATVMTRYSGYVDDVKVLETSNVEVEKVSKKSASKNKLWKVGGFAVGFVEGLCTIAKYSEPG